MKKKMPPKGPGGTPKPDRKKKEFEKIEAINLTLSVERLAGWTKDSIVKYLTDEFTRVAEGLGGDKGPRYNIETGPDTIVEMADAEPYWRTVDVEPIARNRK